MLSVLLPESFGSYPLPLRCLVYSISRFKISPEVRQSPVILMTSLGYYFITVPSYRKNRTLSTYNFIIYVKNPNIELSIYRYLQFSISQKARNVTLFIKLRPQQKQTVFHSIIFFYYEQTLHFHLKNDKIVELIFENGEYDEPIINWYE